jgi:hypothetical protein
VRAVAPEEKARSRRNTPTPANGSSSSVWVSALGHPPTHRAAPVASVEKTITTNPYVGTANRRPASFAPLRLARVIRRMNPSASGTLYSASPGSAEVTAIAPAVTLTATVRTYEVWIAAAATSPGMVPRFSFATMYEPPPRG